MPEFTKGQSVKVPCEVTNGAFLGESMVSISAIDGEVSGFVPTNAILDLSANRGYLAGVVTDIEETIITVRISGSFFTTTGIASLEREWARSNLRAA